MNTFHTSCQITKKTNETFVEHVAVGGVRQRMEYVKDILWIQESETQLRYMHGGEILEAGSTYNDFYGYLTSMRDVGQASVAEKFSVTTESSLELILFYTVFLEPCVETPECAEYNRTKPSNYKHQYAYVPDEWRKEVPSGLFPGEMIYPRVERIELGTGIVWTSKNTPEQNEALAAEFKTKWAINGTRV